MIHPEFRVIEQSNPPAVEATLTPVYPVTAGLQQQRMRSLIASALELLRQSPLEELVPTGLLPGYLAGSIETAIRALHQPPASADTGLILKGIHPWQRRLAFEELLAHQLSLLHLRQRARIEAAPALAPSLDLLPRLLIELPFQLTGAQCRVAQEISSDLAEPRPMLRLVQGDVGSGKTAVSALAALQAIEHGYQVAVMAPTEILAEQHFSSFSNWLRPLGVAVVLLTSRMASAARRETLAALASGEAALAIGTHALFQEQVCFARLALVIIDEQHRFGVHQRLSLRSKGGPSGYTPHQLVMTATPIPRTLAMTAYADLDCSIIDELPPGRLPVETVIVNSARRERVIERVRDACIHGRQAYWVCTLIDESEILQCQAAESTAKELAEQLPGIGIGLIHGRMSTTEKKTVMARFQGAELLLLVATTVIEVGVDVPGASMMIIENAERLGLAQLHQLRGRVGRGGDASHCVLMYQAPLSGLGRQRLQALREISDGFALAERDLELRGPGELLGTRQTGSLDLRIADLQRDQDLIDPVRHAARRMLDDCPDQSLALIRRWLADRARYANA